MATHWRQAFRGRVARGTLGSLHTCTLPRFTHNLQHTFAITPQSGGTLSSSSIAHHHLGRSAGTRLHPAPNVGARHDATFARCMLDGCPVMRCHVACRARMQGFPMLFFFNLEQATLHSGQDIQEVSPSNRFTEAINSSFWGCLELPGSRFPSMPVYGCHKSLFLQHAASNCGHHRRCRTPSASLHHGSASQMCPHAPEFAFNHFQSSRSTTSEFATPPLR